MKCKPAHYLMHGLTQSWTRLQTRCVMFPTGHQAPLQFVPHSKPATLPKNLDKKTLLLLLRVPLGGSGCIQWSGRAETGMCDKLCQRHLEDYQQTEIAFYASAVLDTLHPVEITFMYRIWGCRTASRWVSRSHLSSKQQWAEAQHWISLPRIANAAGTP